MNITGYLRIFEEWSILNIAIIVLMFCIFSLFIVLYGFLMWFIIRKILKQSFSALIRESDLISMILLGSLLLSSVSFIVNYLKIQRELHFIIHSLFVISAVYCLIKYLTLNGKIILKTKIKDFILIFLGFYSIIVTIYLYHTLSNFVLPYSDGWFNHGKAAVIVVSEFYIRDPSLFPWLLAEFYKLSFQATANAYILSGLLHWIPLAIILLILVDLSGGEKGSIIISCLVGLTGTYTIYYGLVHNIWVDFNNIQKYVHMMLFTVGPFSNGVLFPSYSSPRTIFGVSGLLSILYSLFLMQKASSSNDLTRATMLFISATLLLLALYPPYLIPTIATFILSLAFFFVKYKSASNRFVFKRAVTIFTFQSFLLASILLYIILSFGMTDKNLPILSVFLLPPAPFLIENMIRYINNLTVKYFKKHKVIQEAIYRFGIPIILYIYAGILLTSILSVLTTSKKAEIFVSEFGFLGQKLVYPYYEWWHFLSAHAPLLILVTLVILIIWLKNVKIRDSIPLADNSLTELLYAFSLFIFLQFLSIIASHWGLYYSNRTITEWVEIPLIFLVTILYSRFKQHAGKRAMLTLLVLIIMALPGTIFYSYYIANYNPLFNKLNKSDIMLLEELRKDINEGNPILVLPFSTDLEYLSNYVAAVPTYTTNTREAMEQEIRQIKDPTIIRDVLKKYEANVLLLWNHDPIVTLLKDFCYKNECKISESSNLVLIHVPFSRKSWFNYPFLVEHSQLWAEKR